MPQWTGNYSRDMFPSSRRKQYVKSREQQGTEVSDADGNDNTDLLYEKVRNFLAKFGGNSYFFDEAFQVIANGTSNNFGIGSGSGFVAGHETYLSPLLPNSVTGESIGTSTGGDDVMSATAHTPVSSYTVYADGVSLTELLDYTINAGTGVVTLFAGQTSSGEAITIDYEWYDYTQYDNGGTSVEDKNLHSISTDLVATVLTDTAMNWATNELTGRILVPNIEDGSTFSILSNTATTITVAGDMSAVAGAGDSYLVKISTPSGAHRTDAVWLNVYLDEIDATEDPYLNHNLGSGIELDRRIKVRTILMVEEGTSNYADYTDVDGNDHYLVKLATINRMDGVPQIPPFDVGDERVSFGSGEGGGGTVRVTARDTLPQELSSKLTSGAGINLATLNAGGVERLEISAPGSTTDERVAAAVSNTPRFLFDAIEAGSGIVKSLSGVAPNQLVRLSSTGGGGGGGGGTAWVEKFTATPGQTVFGPFANTYTTGVSALFVYINGKFVDHTLYSESGTDEITLTGWSTLLGGETVIVLIPRGDGQIQVSDNDTTFGYLSQKLAAGTGITITQQNDGGDESLLISGGGAGSQILDVVAGGRYFYGSSGTATIVNVPVPSGCTAMRISAASDTTDYDWDSSGYFVVNFTTGYIDGAYNLTNVAYGGGGGQVYVLNNQPIGVFYAAHWVYVSQVGWPGTSNLVIWALGRYGHHHSDRVTVELLG